MSFAVRLPRPRPWWLALSSLALTAVVVISPGTQAAAISTVVGRRLAIGALGLRAAMTPGRARASPGPCSRSRSTVCSSAPRSGRSTRSWAAAVLRCRPRTGCTCSPTRSSLAPSGCSSSSALRRGGGTASSTAPQSRSSAGLAIWQFLIVNTGLIDDGELFQRVVLASYPLLDVVLVAALLWLLLMPGRRCAVRVVPQHRPLVYARARPRTERRRPAQP